MQKNILTRTLFFSKLLYNNIIMNKSLRSDILSFVEKKYNIVPDYPWKKYPSYAILRHRDCKKWFALIANVSYEKLGISKKDTVDILNLKTDSIVIGGFLKNPGILPAYHMNKASWISIILDGSVPLHDIEFLINVSFELTKNKNVHLKH